MSPPRRLRRDAVVDLQAETIARHGGAHGVRDPGLLESALMRPENAHAYAGVDDLFSLAALYAAGISGNHPFIDGNKRAAFAAAGTFLRINGFRLRVAQAEATEKMLALAAGMMDDVAFADWLRSIAVAADDGARGETKP